MSARHPCKRTRTASGDHHPPVTEARRELLSAAVELGVDREDITFASREEQLLWEDLEREFHEFVAKIGPVWIAD
jgi:hypothetical protein